MGKQSSGSPCGIVVIFQEHPNPLCGSKKSSSKPPYSLSQMLFTKECFEIEKQ